MKRPLGQKRWRVLPCDRIAADQLQLDTGLHPIIATLLVQRGITTSEAANEFLDPSLSRLHDPFLLPDAEVACERLKLALKNREKILVYGDYDSDGVTSAALWTRTLRSLGGIVDVFVPHRKRDGYDMRNAGVDQAKAKGVSLIVTTDCGIQRVDEVEYARENGIDVIITDHHTPNSSGNLPKAVAVVNPHRKDSIYPFPDLAGVGVAFKMGEALTRSLGYSVDSFRRSYLDLATIGTVTDIMPLVGENRIIVKHGLEALQNTKKPGLRALLEIAGYKEKTLDTRSIGFGIGPRLNAASRVDETQHALDLLLTKDDAEAQILATRLNDLNTTRREITTKIVEEAMEQIASQGMHESKCLVLHGSGWPSGIVGLVASQVVKQFNRPCIVISMNEATGVGKGSARSIHPFNVFNAIDKCQPLLNEYGGHAYAAGLSINKESLEDFRDQMNHLANEELTDEDLLPSIDVAAEISPDEITPQLLEELERMAPFGSGNHEPLFASRSVGLNNVLRLGAEKQHLKLMLRMEGVNRYDQVDGLWWNMAESYGDVLESGMSLDVCYAPQFNFWNGKRSIQVKIEDVKPPEW